MESLLVQKKEPPAVYCERSWRLQSYRMILIFVTLCIMLCFLLSFEYKSSIRRQALRQAARKIIRIIELSMALSARSEKAHNITSHGLLISRFSGGSIGTAE